ncbi:MAG TPA: response regulator transcription factor [Candidatus Limnocylindria bacterium]|nr:response regulator transcription factor [Candidatus Limnocylindria bacterium]
MRTLIVDDERDTAEVVAAALSDDGHAVRIAENGREALATCGDWSPDLIVLDILMPGMDGLSICVEVRKHSTVPILILSARCGAMDRVIAIRLGADDFMTKPFDLEELRARVAALLRRSLGAARAAAEVVIGDLRVDLRAHRAFARDRELDLTAGEYRLLRELVASPGLVIRRTDLSATLGLAAGSRGADIHVARLRRKFEEADLRVPTLETARGFGYRLGTPARSEDVRTAA